MKLINNVQVYGLENSIRISKFPMTIDPNIPTTEITNTTIKLGSVPTGTGHDNFLKGIVVQFDLTFTNKAWTELQRYHFHLLKQKHLLGTLNFLHLLYLLL